MICYKQPVRSRDELLAEARARSGVREFMEVYCKGWKGWELRIDNYVPICFVRTRTTNSSESV